MERLSFVSLATSVGHGRARLTDVDILYPNAPHVSFIISEIFENTNIVSDNNISIVCNRHYANGYCMAFVRELTIAIKFKHAINRAIGQVSNGLVDNGASSPRR